MTDLQIFNSPEFGTIRTIDKGGEPWFVGKDVANALGFTNSRDAISTHVFLEDRGVDSIDTPLTSVKPTATNNALRSSSLPTDWVLKK